jgi:hypothetical protein
MRLHPLAPVVAVDIDGTTGDYYRHFKWFAELYLQTHLTLDWSDTTEFSEALDLDKETYRAIKLAYRQGGMKRSLPLLNGNETAQLIPAIRERLGVQVWVCTTRPWQRLDNIDPDTQWWINHHWGRVDGVIYGEEKYEDLLDIVGEERILGIWDDLPENIIRARRLGLNTALRAGDHNESWMDLGLHDGSTALIRHNNNFFPLVKAWKEQKENQ